MKRRLVLLAPRFAKIDLDRILLGPNPLPPRSRSDAEIQRFGSATARRRRLMDTIQSRWIRHPPVFVSEADDLGGVELSTIVHRGNRCSSPG